MRKKIITSLQHNRILIEVVNTSNKRLSLYVNNKEVDFIYFEDWKKNHYLYDTKQKIKVILNKKIIGYSITIYYDNSQIQYVEKKFKRNITFKKY